MNLIIYVRCDMAFGDIVELSEGTDSESFSKRSLFWAGPNEFLGKNLICVARDGAEVLFARAGQLLTEVKQDLPKVQSIHCLAQHLS